MRNALEFEEGTNVIPNNKDPKAAVGYVQQLKNSNEALFVVREISTEREGFQPTSLTNETWKRRLGALK